MNASLQMVRYDAMVHAIAACHSVDEVTEIHDKALALELYAKQAMNVEAEREATEIRLRAERRAGEMLAELQRATKDRKSEKYQAATVAGRSSEYRETLERAGINERTGRRWQELADVPEATFEQHLNGEEKPTTNAILRAVNGSTRMDEGSYLESSHA